MPKHADDEPVVYGYGSSRNISMRGEGELGFTWGEWRVMDEDARREFLNEIVFELVEVYVKDDED